MVMPVKFEISVVMVGKSLKVTIPVAVAKHLSISKGDMVDMWVDDHQIIIKKQN